MPLNLKPNSCFVIAEAGTAHADTNWSRRLPKALKLVRAAAEAGADAIKFQWFSISNAPIRDDMFCWIDGDDAREPRWSLSAMWERDWRQVKEYAEACGLVFLASAFQERTVVWLREFGLAATKVASRAAKSFPYDMEGLPQPFLVSNGWLFQQSAVPKDAIVLDCEAKYPSSRAWQVDWPGFSDHSGKPFLGIDAISRGCKLLEVHFMVDPLDAGPDLPACLTVEELKLICQARDYYAKRAA